LSGNETGWVMSGTPAAPRLQNGLVSSRQSPTLRLLESLYQTGKPLSGLVGPTASSLLGEAVTTSAFANVWATMKLARTVTAAPTSATVFRGDRRNDVERAKRWDRRITG
jgi:hypothetical protein